jgi:hypothetical protein
VPLNGVDRRFRSIQVDAPPISTAGPDLDLAPNKSRLNVRAPLAREKIQLGHDHLQVSSTIA